MTAQDAPPLVLPGEEETDALKDQFEKEEGDGGVPRRNDRVPSGQIVAKSGPSTKPIVRRLHDDEEIKGEENEANVSASMMGGFEASPLKREESQESLNINEENESMSEMKKETAIPLLKNNHKPHRNHQFKPFSERAGTNDPLKVTETFNFVSSCASNPRRRSRR